MYRAEAGAVQADVRDFLLDGISTGQVQVGLSYFVVFELLQAATPQHREDRIARARFLSRVCGSNAFPYVTDLRPDNNFRTDGVWWPADSVAEFDVEKLLKLVHESVLKEVPMNRKTRRMYGHRHAFAEWLRQNPKFLGAIASADFPLPLHPEFMEGAILRRYALGRISREAANSVLRKSIAEPESLFRVWFDHYGKSSPVTQMGREFAENISVALSQLKEIKDVLLQLRRSGQINSETWSDIRLRKITRNFNKEWRDRIDEMSREVLDPEVLYHRFARNFSDEQAHVASDVLYALAFEGRELEPSIGADVMHSLYLPSVDIWRGDSAFSHVLIKHEVRYSEKIVQRLEDLPARIRAFR